MATYAAMVDGMDQGIGRVMRKLRDLGIEKNTLVLFLSDNGGCAEFLAKEGWINFYPDRSPRGEEIVQGNIPDLPPGSGTTFQSYQTAWSNVSNAPFWMHKTWVHEGGISTPLVAFWPEGITSPGIVHNARHVSDIMPTILDVTGESYPKDFGGVGVQNLDGESLIDTFRNIYRQCEQPI